MNTGTSASIQNKGHLPLVGIIVLNWNKHNMTEVALRSIACLDYKNFFVVVLDNGSTAEGFEELKIAFSDVTFLNSPVNLGFTGGMNTLMRHAFDRGADYVWMFNNDAECNPDVLSKLIAKAGTIPRIGLISPLVANQDQPDTYQVTGAIVLEDGVTLKVSNQMHEGRSLVRAHPDRVAVVGAAALFSRSAHEEVGGFDETFFAYQEDIDLSIRCLRAGFINIYMDDVTILHERKKKDSGDQVAPHVSYYMSRNAIILMDKYRGFHWRIKAAYWEAAKRLKEIVKNDLLTLSPLVAQAMLAAIWDGFFLRGGEYTSRRSMPWILRTPLLWIAYFFSKNNDVRDLDCNPPPRAAYRPAIRSVVMASVQTLVLAPMQEAVRWGKCRSLRVSNAVGVGARSRSGRLSRKPLHRAPSSATWHAVPTCAATRFTAGDKNCGARQRVSPR